MSKTGQTASDKNPAPYSRPWGEGPPRPVLGMSRDLLPKEMIGWHRHVHTQLLYASTGLMKVRTPMGAWVVPPQRAVWIPARLEHEVTCVGHVAIRNIYVTARAEVDLPETCRVISVSPLLRELILAAVALPRAYALEGPAGRLIAVLLDNLAAARTAGLHLPLPRDRRLRAVCNALFADPADGRSLEDWSRSAGASARTLARLFLAETGLSFRAWRQQLRLHEALARLTEGEPVTSVAYAVGYDSPSAFIAMFRKALGETPSRYLERGSDYKH